MVNAKKLKKPDSKVKFDPENDHDFPPSSVPKKEDPGLVVSVQINEDSGKSECLLLMTADMKETFHGFPKVLFLDATYNTNRLMWPLFTFLVEDGHGKGQPVSYVLLPRETNINIENFVEKLTGFVDISGVKVVIVDKDYIR